MTVGCLVASIYILFALHFIRGFNYSLNPSRSTQCDRSLNRTVWHSVVPLPAKTVEENKTRIRIPFWEILMQWISFLVIPNSQCPMPNSLNLGLNVTHPITKPFVAGGWILNMNFLICVGENVCYCVCLSFCIFFWFIGVFFELFSGQVPRNPAGYPGTQCRLYEIWRAFSIGLAVRWQHLERLKVSDSADATVEALLALHERY